MTTAQEISARAGRSADVARQLSDAELHAEIALCERIGSAGPAWRLSLYEVLLVERFQRPPIIESPSLVDLDEPLDEPLDGTFDEPARGSLSVEL